MRGSARRADVLVVGGGPAGALTSLLLARRGIDVALVDRARFPRAKACGEFVNPGALRLLDRLGLGRAATRASDNAIGGWELRTDNASRASGDYGGAWGLGIRREEFDTRLLDAARESGVHVSEETAVRGIEYDPLGAKPVRVGIRERGGVLRQVQTRMLVGADGLNSIVARSLSGLVRPPRRVKLSLSAHIRGAGPDRAKGHMYVASGLTVGMAAYGPEDGWNVTVVVDPRRDGRQVRSDPNHFVIDRLARVGLDWTDRPQMVRAPRASGPFDRPVRRVAGPGFVLVGDASGYYDPLTGQGIYRALRSAELAATHIAEALTNPSASPDVVMSYARALVRDRRPGRTVQHAVEHVMASRRLRPWMVRRLAARAEVLDALLRVTGDVAPSRTLVHPTVWGPLLI